MCINKPHWQSSGIMLFLFKCYTVISYTLVSFFLDVLFLLLAVILSELYEKPRRKKDWVSEKCTKKNLCEGHHFLTAHSPYYAIFSSSTLLLKWRTCWMIPIKRHNISMGGILFDTENMKISCNLIITGGISKNVILF